MNAALVYRAALLAMLATAGCRAIPQSLGTATESASQAADGLFGGIAARFTNPVRDAKVRAARRTMTRALLTPSRVFADTAAWTTPSGASVRAIAWRGFSQLGRYEMVTDSSHAPPAQPGDGRHVTRLRRLGDGEYEWLTASDFGIGATTPAAMAALPVAWLAAGERSDSVSLRAELRAAFPRSSRVWGRLFSLRSAGAQPAGVGAWRQRIVVTMHPDRAAQFHPAFARWLREYVSPARIRVRLRDSSRTWFDLSIRSDTIAIDVRTQDGRLLPLEGGLTPMPDTVTLELDVSAKFLLFRVGFQRLRADFVTVRDSTQRGWSMRFNSDPEWQLPLLTERMLRTPLRRPFSGPGSHFRIVAHADPAAPQTTLSRRLLVPVEESAILRFLSRLVNTGVGDYVEGADRETNEWLAAAFAALREDARAVLDPEKTETPPR